uniref:Protein kinase domain-containing protein n=1 Tax=Macrostomum lignano TaxID=282301 RepID=A0A1I8F681_9PLAT
VENDQLLIPSLLPVSPSPRRPAVWAAGPAGFPCETTPPCQRTAWNAPKLSLVSSSSAAAASASVAVPHQRANGASFAASSQSSSAPVYVPFPPKEPGAPRLRCSNVKLDDIDSRLGASAQKLPQSQQQQPPPISTQPELRLGPTKTKFSLKCESADISRQLSRLYIMTYFPSGFWPRLLTKLIGDRHFANTAKGLYRLIELFCRALNDCLTFPRRFGSEPTGCPGRPDQHDLATPAEQDEPVGDSTAPDRHSIRAEAKVLPGTRHRSYHLRCSRQAATVVETHRLVLIGGLVPRLGTRFNQTAEGMFLVTPSVPLSSCACTPKQMFSKIWDPDKILSIEQVKILSFIGKGNFGTVFSRLYSNKGRRAVRCGEAAWSPYPLTADCSEEDQRLYKEEAPARGDGSSAVLLQVPTCRPGLSCHILLRLHHPNVLNLYGVLAPQAASPCCLSWRPKGASGQAENCLVWNFTAGHAAVGTDVNDAADAGVVGRGSAGIGGGSGDRGGSGGGNERGSSRLAAAASQRPSIITEAFCGWRWRTTLRHQQDHPYRGYAGTLAYMAPEILEFHGEETYTEKADIYSFGMLLYELITLKPPFIDEATKSVRQNLVSYILKGGRPLLYDTDVAGVPVPLLDLLAVCWAQSSRLRPSAAQIRAACQSAAFCARFGCVRDASGAAVHRPGGPGLVSSVAGQPGAVWATGPAGDLRGAFKTEACNKKIRRAPRVRRCRLVHTFGLGVRPQAMCVEPDHAKLWVGLSTGILAVFDCDNWERVAEIPVLRPGQQPQDSFQQLLAARPAVLPLAGVGRLYGSAAYRQQTPSAADVEPPAFEAAAHCGGISYRIL